MRCRLFAVFALLLPVLALAAPRAWLDRDRIEFGETVTLNVETDARGGSEPDFSVLDEKFWRIGTSSSTQLSIVNGRQTARTLWAVALEPREQGVIGIPALAVGREQTAPLTLTVLPAASGGAAGDADVFVEIDASPRDPYVQQEVRYTVRLYYAVTLLEGQLEDPQAQGALVRRLGQDITYYRTVGSRRYQVAERRYSIVPESSGELVIPGPRFGGRALRAGNFGSLLGSNARLNARGDEITLQVRPRPAGAPDPWLPATSLTLEDESGAGTGARVGEPLTLTLRLHAQGLAAEQLPELTLPPISGAQVYPDQETTQTRGDGDGVHGERVRKFAIVPTRPGPLTLPEVGIDWWDVERDAAARARLPSRVVQVAPGAGAGALPPPALESATSDTAVSPHGTAPDDATAPALRNWQLAAIVFASLWMLTLAMFALRARSRRATTPAKAPEPAPSHVSWRALDAASDAQAAARIVIEAARGTHPSCRNLADVWVRLEDEKQRGALQQLERVLYRGVASADALAELRAAFRGGAHWRRPLVPASDAELPPLYPDTR